MIQNYYVSETKEFSHTERVDLTSGNVVSLVNAHIIYAGTKMDTHGIYNYRDLPKVKNIYRDRSVIKIKKGLRIYSSKKVVLSEQEKQDYEKRIQKQVEKYEM